MFESAEKLIPIFIAFFAAFTAKKCRLLQARDGDSLLKIAFYITIPPLVFVSASHIELSRDLLLFPLLPLLLVVASFFVARLLSSHQHLSRAQKGVFEAAPMAINSGFALPFLLSIFGQEGVARVVLFNTMNNPLIFIWVYAIIAAHSPHNTGKIDVLKRVLLSPPLWALALGLFCNIADITISTFARDALLGIGNLTGMTIIIALGLTFSPVRAYFGKAMLVLFARMGVGLIIGSAVVVFAHQTGVNRAAILLLASAPVGFNILTFTSLEKLDEKFAASIVSYSIPVGLVLASFVILLNNR